MMAKFNKSQSKYKVVWTGWPANQYEDHVNTQVQAGGIDADVMTLIPDLAARLVKQGGVLEPINSNRQEGRRSPERLAQLHPQGRQPLRQSASSRSPSACSTTRRCSPRPASRRRRRTPEEWLVRRRSS